jgi:c-di-GMP-related signal transduction protein
MLTKIANTAMTDGLKVLQIFFEDNPKVIQRKHLACWSKISLNELSTHREDIMDIVTEMTAKKVC